MAVTKYCVVCGKLFQAKSSAKTCSVECRKINNRKVNNKWHYFKYYDQKGQNDLESCKSLALETDVANAKKLGMTYGKYKAQQFLKREREIKNAENKENL